MRKKSKFIGHYLRKERKMKLSTPTNLVFWIATVLAALGLIGSLVSLPFVSTYAFWFVVIGFVLLWLGNVMKGF